jgi:hypothetical protein
MLWQDKTGCSSLGNLLGTALESQSQLYTQAKSVAILVAILCTILLFGSQ